MTNLEANKDEIYKIIDKGYPLSCSVCSVMNNFDIENGCSGVRCEMTKELDWMFEEYKETIKLKQWEKDLLETYQEELGVDHAFYSNYILKELKDRGHFKGVMDTSMNTRRILENCEVIDD